MRIARRVGSEPVAHFGHSAADSASQASGLQGRVVRSSKADIHSDWEKSTACWVSQRKQSNAKRFFCSTSIAIRHLLSRSRRASGKSDNFTVWQSLRRIRLSFGQPPITASDLLGDYDLLDEHTMKQMRHLVLFLACAGFAEAFGKKDDLKHPQLGRCGESSMLNGLCSHNVVDADRQTMSLL